MIDDETSSLRLLVQKLERELAAAESNLAAAQEIVTQLERDCFNLRTDRDAGQKRIDVLEARNISLMESQT